MGLKNLLSDDLSNANFKSEDSIDNSEDDAVAMEAWKNRRRYLLSCTGYVVGLFNFWRFPWFVKEFGGGIEKIFLTKNFQTLKIIGKTLVFKLQFGE